MRDAMSRTHPSLALPNVVLIIADDMGAGDVPCVPGGHPLVRCGAPSFGHPYAEMPALSRLGEEGTQFLQAYTMGLTCAPSRAALMTGRFPHRLPMPPAGPEGLGSATSVSELLTARGYMAAHFGKWNLGLTPRHDLEPPNGTYAFGVLNAQGWPPGVREAVEAAARRNGSGTWWGRDTLHFDHAIGWLERVARPPFYMHVWAHTPHRPIPRHPPNKKIHSELAAHFAARLENVNASLFGPHTRARRVLERLASPGTCDGAKPGKIADGKPCTLMSLHACRELQKCDKHGKENIGDMSTFRQGMADYLGELWALDHHVGRLVTAVDGAGARTPRAFAAPRSHAGRHPRGVHIHPACAWPCARARGAAADLLPGCAGLRDSTIVVFTSDHGPEGRLRGELGSTGLSRGMKSWLSEGGVRIPYIVRWPGHVRAGRVDATSVISNADWLPTLSAIVGARQLSARTSAPLGLDGVDVSSRWLTVADRHAGHSRCAPLYWLGWDKVEAGMVPNCVLRDGPHKVYLRCGEHRVMNHSSELCAAARAAPREYMTVYDIPADPGEAAPLPYDAVGAARMRWLHAMLVAQVCREADGRWGEGALPPPRPTGLAGGAQHHHCAAGSPAAQING